MYICIYPSLEVQNPQMHPSQASPAHTYTVGSKGRPGVSMSRLLAGLQASRATVRYDIVSLRCLKAREEDRQTDRQTAAPTEKFSIDANKKTDSSRQHFSPVRQGDQTDRQDRKRSTMHLGGLSQTPREMLEGPRGAGSCLHLGDHSSPRCKHEPAMLD